MRTGILIVTLLSALLSGCLADDPAGPGVSGTAGDVTTAPGAYAGYRVIAPCEGTWVDVGVTGTGAIVLTEVEAIAAAGQDLHTRLADVSSIWGWGGYGLACEAGIGTQVMLDDWRDVDPLVVRIGAWLRERDLALQVGISVGSIPVPHAQ